jgi:hypothetical protein
MPEAEEVAVAAGEPIPAGRLDTREALGGVEPLTSTPKIRQGEGSLPIWGRYDVVVVGGGTAGAPAAIAAARAGARTLVIEMSGVLGGVGSNGIGWLFMGYRDGFAAEFVKAAHANFRAAHGRDYPRKRGDDRDRPFMFPLQRSYWLMDLLTEAGVDVWFTTMGTGTINEANRVRGVVLASPMGRGVVLAKRVIDATGDGDISVAAGADYRLVSPTSHHLQHAGYTGDHAIVDGFMNSNTGPIDPAHVAAVTSFLRKNRGRNIHKDLYDFYYQLLFRETRRIVCDATITYLDQVLERRYADTIAVTRSSFDKHGEASSVYRNIRLRTDRNHLQATPYRALLPKGIEGLIVTGRCRSATSDALPKTRMQSDMMNEGYAAGRCAAYSAMTGKPLRDIDLSEIQEHLLEIGAIPDESFLAQTPSPSPEQLKEAAGDPRRRNAAMLLAWPGKARAVLKASFDAEPTPRRAHLLCLLGDKTVVPFLIRHLTGEAELHERLRSVWALGETGDDRATMPIVAFLGRPPVRHGKHRDDPTRAAAVALGKIGDKRAIPALKKTFDQINKYRRDEEPGVSLAIALHACGHDMSSYFREVIQSPDKLAARRVARFLAGPAGTPVAGEHDSHADR